MNAQTQITRFASQAILTSAFLLNSAQAAEPKAAPAPAAGKVEVVAQLPIRPGNVAATEQGRVFATVHPLDKPTGVQLIEITGKQQYRA